MPENDDSLNKSEFVTKKKSPFWLSLVIVLIFLSAGAFFGYKSGISDRKNAANEGADQQLAAQFQQGVKALESGLYQVALQNFQYIIQQDPNYPGAQDKLVEVLVALNFSLTPTKEPTPVFTSTPDRRGAEIIYNQARDLYKNMDWSGTIDSLDSLRKADSSYKTVEVDGMYYMSLIQRGEGKIANQDCTSINLEGGIYDLTLAERFGPLDNYAQSLRNWARLYITGASFWEIDWNQAIFYFDQLYRNMPYMMDSSCMTSTQRYRFAAIKYADSLVASGDICGAKQYYDLGLLISNQENALVIPTATYVWEKCEESSFVPVVSTPTSGTITPTVTATPTLITTPGTPIPSPSSTSP